MRLKILLLCIATFGFAGQIDGNYIGDGGEISISQKSASSLMFMINDSGCGDITGTAKKMGKIWRYYDTPKDSTYHLQLDFKVTGDVITVKSKYTQPHCGRYDSFDNTFVKSKQQTFDESKPELTNKEYIAIKKSVEEYAKADLELSKAYKKLMNLFTFQQKQELKEEQRLWIKMRDEQAFQVGPKNSYEYSSKLTELTKERAEYLSTMAK